MWAKRFMDTGTAEICKRKPERCRKCQNVLPWWHNRWGNLYARFWDCSIAIPHNQRLKKCDILVFLAKVPKICTPGDSGGATFIQCRVDGKEYWLLCGIVAGGDTERQVNAIQPIDEVIRTIRFDSRRLIDFPEYWWPYRLLQVLLSYWRYFNERILTDVQIHECARHELEKK